ncbi:MAG: head-tail connector protein [Clostridium celatum]|nr:head-tail connector protein [Clostridium celatum]
MTLERVKNHLRIDFDEDDIYISDLIEISGIYIESCVGSAYKSDSKAVKLSELLQLKLIQDIYDNRGTEIPVDKKKDLIVTTILDKLSNFSEV